jgi:type IX secretion system PorP/SprF family membrane protein
LKLNFKNIFIILVVFLRPELYAQQLPLYTQYMNNGFLVNPAMSGYDGYTSYNMTYRKQWLGFTNSPTTYSISGQTRILKESYHIKKRNVRKNAVKQSTKGRVGLGGFAFNDKNGLVSRTGVQFSYAYHIFLHQSQISFGLAAQAFQYKIDEDKLIFGNENSDPIKNNGLNTVAFIPDANFGFYWTSDKYYLGFSANQLFQSRLKLGSSDLGHLKLYRHYYFMGGYKFDLNSGFQFEPSALLKTTEQFLPQADIGIKLYYQNDYWAGLSYRTSGSIAAMFGVRVNQFYFGYAYDYALSSIRKHSFGSHEILLSVKFGSNARRYRWTNRY